ncbi:MAG: DEAD/DEAH box helicase [Armatimonadota bacterium]|nr:DEAD/DEAH box helicase [Armatimonadota bacterium]MDR7452121.1 DEAD/DEAH box helicase [Armatimonadota bacterium]MDR7467845.1 DEAD/DEAH box helicase [Armatimonadota bacterium]MDR7494733.1 DEAD/DEAH box helicase [Armatimonadota bacterium]MDR7499558.1 DEAD/DEAH box helicase [Armatimonadota bacterium]
MTLRQILDRLFHDPHRSSRIAAWREIPARPPRYVPFPEGLDPALVSALRRRGIEQLYAHQGEAYDAVRGGAHIAVVTPTASGKTLCYNLPVLERILREPETRALYLFPTKALSADQVDELQGLVGLLGREIKTFTYDGDTPASARRAIRAAGHIVVTNPDMLHTAILPHHTKWLRLFENLRYVVIDELHQYRGVFGSHVANVLRRLRRICAFYGSRPQFIGTSATIGNPREHAERLIGAPVTLIDRTGAPGGEKVIAFINPPLVNRELGIRRDTLMEVRDLAADLIHGGIPTIVFGRSRLAAELLTTYLKDLARDHGRDPDAIQGYRAGYLPGERRAIERGLREGTVQVVAATNALELGIDIGQLGAAILAGYPGTIASTWQQMGRAGRGRDLSAAFLVATSDPLDQYIVRHPEYFFEHSPEQALINPDNPLVLTSHLKCAAFELPLGVDEPYGAEPPVGILQALAAQKIVHCDGRRWHYIAERFPAEEVSLRSASTENVVIIDETAPKPEVVGEVDLASAPALVHEDAIYLHLGRQYHVERLDWEQRRAHVKQVDVDYYTDAEIAVGIHVLREDGAVRDLLPRAHGDVAVTFRPTIFKKLKLFTQENIGWGRIALPETTMHTTAAWWVLPPALAGGWANPRLQGALAALSHALLNIAPLYLMADPNDLGRVYEIRSPHTGHPTIYLYERVPGGVGLAERMFRLHDELVRAAIELVDGCACDRGCPSCVGPVLEVGDTGKADAVEILRASRRPATAAAGE